MYSGGAGTNRVAAVLNRVSAMPPLVLVTPIAIVTGLSHAARYGVVVRDGGGRQLWAGPGRCELADQPDAASVKAVGGGTCCP
jgi:hypothetical protein